MSSASRRHRSSTAASTPPTPESLQNINALLDGLSDVATASAVTGYPDVYTVIKKLRDIAQQVSAEQEPSRQDDFRHAGGFERVLNMLRAFSGFYDPVKRSETEMVALFRLLEAFLAVLSSAMRNHAGNRRFFRYRVDGGGWDALEQTIARIGLGGTEPDPWVSCQVFGKLLAFALGDDALDLLCQSIAKTLRPEANDKAEGEDETAEDQWDLVLARSVENIGPSVREIINAKTVIRHPEILRILIRFWTAIPRQTDGPANPASSIVLEAIGAA